MVGILEVIDSVLGMECNVNSNQKAQSIESRKSRFNCCWIEVLF
jgi:hypothetical protein